jgi:hypothetical protein
VIGCAGGAALASAQAGRDPAAWPTGRPGAGAEAWQAARHRRGRGVNWRFTIEDARTKLKRRYPTTQY